MPKTKKMLTMTLMFITVNIGCGSDGGGNDPEPPTTVIDANPCVTRGAAYQFTHRKTSGDCPDLPQETLIIPQDGKIALVGCVTHPDYRYEGCKVIIHATCESGNLTVEQTGTMLWADDGSAGEGSSTVKTRGKDGSTCIGTYSTSAIRQ